jgi:hypothetical protein
MACNYTEWSSTENITNNKIRSSQRWEKEILNPKLDEIFGWIGVEGVDETSDL